MGAYLVESSNSIHLLSFHCWDTADADISLFYNACLLSLGFWCPALNMGFMHVLGTPLALHNIIFLEALTVALVLQ